MLANRQQQLLIYKHFENCGIKVIKRLDHVRGKIAPDDKLEKKLEELFDNSVVVQLSQRQKSKRYATYLVKFLKPWKNIQRGVEFDLVNAFAVSSAIKALTPSSLGLSGKIIKIDNFVDVVINNINERVANEAVKSLLKNIIYNAQGKEKFNKELAKILSFELNNIANDFGEISGALWYSKKVNGDYVEFPKASNLPLVDYFVTTKNKEIKNVSAKAGKGSTPSLKAINNTLLEYSKKATGRKKEVSLALYNLSVMPITDGLLEFAKFIHTYYSCPGYSELKKIFKNVTKENISKTLLKLDSVDNVRNFLSDYFKAIGKGSNISNSSIEKVMKTKSSKVYGIVTSPLTYHVVDLIRKYDIFSEVLETIVKQLDVVQVYMNLSTTKCDYSVKEFRTSEFEWYEPRVSVLYPDINRIGFRIK